MGYFATLGLAALIHGNNRAVQLTAKRLAEKAPRSFCRNTLLPLSQTDEAYDIIMDTAVNVTEEFVMGVAKINEMEYDVVLHICDRSQYSNEEVVVRLANEFLRMGTVQGRLYFDLTHPFLHTRFRSSLDMERFANEAAYGAAA